MIELNKIYNADCLEFMRSMPGNCVDLVVTDPPYGMTKYSWDKIVDFDKMWCAINRVIRQKTAVIMFGSQPFSSKLICSNIKNFKYEWIWNKRLSGNPLNSKIAPLKIHENIMVFNSHNYYPTSNSYCPKSILDCDAFSMGNRNKKDLYHPTQKPLDLIKYLVLTYSKEGDTVFDPFMGSGTTAVACKELNRNFIGCEIESKYCEIAEKRLRETVKGLF